MYETCKLFDITNMPDNLSSKIYDEYRGTSNDVIIELYTEDEEIRQWFTDNGAEKDDQVLLKYWW